MAVRYAYDAANRLVEANGTLYTWDANGNLLSDGALTYAYDSANRLIAVSGQGSAYSFAYNGLGDRVSQTVNGAPTNYTLDLNAGLTQVLADGSNTYLYGNGRIAQYAGATPSYFLGDALGSVRQLVDSADAVTLAKNYAPYGNVMGSAGNGASAYGYAREQQSGGLVYLRARYYASGVGRFLTRDVWDGDFKQPMSFNKWLYAYADPIRYTDPSGQKPYPCSMLPHEDCGVDDPPLPIPPDSGGEGDWGRYGEDCRWYQPPPPEPLPSLIAEKVRETYRVLREHPGWWNDNRARNRKFTPQVFLGLLLSMEFNNPNVAQLIDYQLQRETTVRNFYYICPGTPGMKCDTKSERAIYIYIAAKELAENGKPNTGRHLLLSKNENPNSKWIDKRYFWSEADFAGAFQNPKLEWKQGVKGPDGQYTAPMTWGNASMVPSNVQGDFLKAELGPAQDQVYLKRGTGDPFIILNFCQVRYWYENKPLCGNLPGENP